MWEERFIFWGDVRTLVEETVGGKNKNWALEAIILVICCYVTYDLVLFPKSAVSCSAQIKAGKDHRARIACSSKMFSKTASYLQELGMALVSFCWGKKYVTVALPVPDFNRLCWSVAVVYNCCIYLWLKYTEIVISVIELLMWCKFLKKSQESQTYRFSSCPLFQRYVLSMGHVIESNLKRGFRNIFLMNRWHYLLNFLQKPALW